MFYNIPSVMSNERITYRKYRNNPPHSIECCRMVVNKQMSQMNDYVREINSQASLQAAAECCWRAWESTFLIRRAKSILALRHRQTGSFRFFAQLGRWADKAKATSSICSNRKQKT